MIMERKLSSGLCAKQEQGRLQSQGEDWIRGGKLAEKLRNERDND